MSSVYDTDLRNSIEERPAEKSKLESGFFSKQPFFKICKAGLPPEKKKESSDEDRRYKIHVGDGVSNVENCISTLYKAIYFLSEYEYYGDRIRVGLTEVGKLNLDKTIQELEDMRMYLVIHRGISDSGDKIRNEGNYET